MQVRLGDVAAAALALGHDRAVAHDDPAPDHGQDGPADDLAALVEREVRGRGEIALADGGAPFEIDEHEVGVGADPEMALLRVEPEDARRVEAADLHDALEREPAGVDALAQHQREHRLDRRKPPLAGPDGFRLAIEPSRRHVVGADDVDDAVPERPPEPLLALPVAYGRLLLAEL